MSADEGLKKIRDPSVRSLAEAGSDSEVEVLIQLDLPVPEFRPGRSDFPSGRKMFTSLPVEQGDTSSTFEKFGSFLRAIGAKRSHPLTLANAYSASLTADKLSDVATHPMVLGIDANTRRKV